MKIYLLNNKLIAGMLTASIVLGATSIAFAEESVGVQTDIHVRDLRQERHDTVVNLRASTTAAIKAVRESTKIEIKAKLDSKKQEKVLRVIKNHISELSKHINQLSRRTTELTAVSLKIKAAGRDTTQAEGFLIDARAKLAHASSTLLSISATASSTIAATASSTPNEKFNQFKTQFDSINADLKTTHTDLADAISSLKGIGKGIKFDDHHATTTINVTASTTTQ